jgi:hypothetical protein
LAFASTLQYENNPRSHGELSRSSYDVGLDMGVSDSHYGKEVPRALLNFTNAPPHQGPAKIHELIDFRAQTLRIDRRGFREKWLAGRHSKASELDTEEKWSSIDLYGDQARNFNVDVDFERGFRARLRPDGILVFEALRRFRLGATQPPRVVAQHLLHGYRVLSYTINKDMLYFLDDRGYIRAVDMVIAPTMAFHGPIPVFKVAQLPEELQAELLITKQVDVFTIHRGLEAWPDLRFKNHAVYPLELTKEANPKLFGGDLVLRDKEGVIWGWYDFQQVWAKLAMAQMVLAVEAYLVSPQSSKISLVEFMEALKHNPEVRAHMDAPRESMDPRMGRFFSRLPEEIVPKIFVNANNRNLLSKANKEELSDRFSLSEWAESVNEIRDRAKHATEDQSERWLNADSWKSGDYGEDWRSLIGFSSPEAVNKAGVMRRIISKTLGLRQHMTRDNLQKVALLTLAGGVGVGIGYDLTINGLGVVRGEAANAFLSWTFHTLNLAADTLIPDPLQNLGFQLKGSPYWIPLSMHLLTLLTLPVALKALGQYFGARRGWDFMKTLTTAGMRIDAVFNYPIAHAAACLTLQRRLIWAMERGISPWTRIEPDSAMGKALGLKEPLRPTWTPFNEIQSSRSTETTQRGSKSLSEAKAVSPRRSSLGTRDRAVGALLERNRRQDLAAWILANAVVSESSKVDLATLRVMFERGAVALPREIFHDEEFLKRWQKTARQLRLVLSEFEELGVEELKKVSPVALARYYKVARETVHQLENPKSALTSVLAELRLRWYELGKASPVAVAKFGLEENRFSRSAVASSFVSREHWNQYSSDMRFSILFMSGWGARADFSQPERLAADPKGPLMTNPAHFADTLEQTIIYMVPAAASMALLYQSESLKPMVKPRHIDSRFSPIEELQSRQFIEREEAFNEALLAWLKQGLNLPKAAYGEIFLRGIVKQFRTFQGYFLRGSIIRIFVGNQSADVALLAISYTWLVSKLAFGWPFVLVNRTDQLYSEELDKNQRLMEDVRGQLLRAIRSGGVDSLKLATEALIDLYRSRAQQPLTGLVSEVEKVLKSKKDFLKLDAQKLGEYSEDLANLFSAYKGGDRDKLEKAYDLFVARYKGENGITVEFEEGVQSLEDRARKLLIMSDRYAPLPSGFNRALHRTALFSAAAMGTYWASFIIADSYHLGRGEIIERLGDAMLFVPTTFFFIIVGDRLLRKAWSQRFEMALASWLSLNRLQVRIRAWVDLERGLAQNSARWLRGGMHSISKPKQVVKTLNSFGAESISILKCQHVFSR